MKFKDRYIEVTERPCLIIGERPGKQRKNDQNGEVFHGNRSGDFIEKVIEGKTNIVLTNVQQVYYPGSLRLKGKEHSDGIVSLYNLISRVNPKLIICLGQYASQSLEMMPFQRDCKVISLPHPSWTLRFNKSQKPYHEALQHDRLRSGKLI